MCSDDASLPPVAVDEELTTLQTEVRRLHVGLHSHDIHLASGMLPAGQQPPYATDKWQWRSASGDADTIRRQFAGPEGPCGSAGAASGCARAHHGRHAPAAGGRAAARQCFATARCISGWWGAESDQQGCKLCDVPPSSWLCISTTLVQCHARDILGTGSSGVHWSGDAAEENAASGTLLSPAPQQLHAQLASTLPDLPELR